MSRSNYLALTIPLCSIPDCKKPFIAALTWRRADGDMQSAGQKFCIHAYWPETHIRGPDVPESWTSVCPTNLLDFEGCHPRYALFPVSTSDKPPSTHK